jgi:hypothetical protein
VNYKLVCTILLALPWGLLLPFLLTREVRARIRQGLATLDYFPIWCVLFSIPTLALLALPWIDCYIH